MAGRKSRQTANMLFLLEQNYEVIPTILSQSLPNVVPPEAGKVQRDLPPPIRRFRTLASPDRAVKRPGLIDRRALAKRMVLAIQFTLEITTSWTEARTGKFL